MIFLAWFETLWESFSYKEVTVQNILTRCETSFPPTENINETPELPMLSMKSYSWIVLFSYKVSSISFLVHLSDFLMSIF